ncbi:MAG: EAL domain-containing protein [Treponema sp.]|nr:EAL domain-containing protein [Candidatus Treponema caballi]
MKVNRITRRRVIVILFLFLLLLVVGAAGIGGYLVHTIETNLSIETEKYIRIVNKKTSSLVQDRMETALKNLVSVADMMEYENIEVDDAFFDYLETERRKFGFVRMSVAELDGNYRTTDHLSMNVSERQYFQQAMKGFPAISEVLVSGVSGQNAIIFAVPVYKQGVLSYVLTGTHEFRTLQDFFSRGTFEETGETYILDKKGNIVLSSVDSEVRISKGNILELIASDFPEIDGKFCEQAKQILKNGSEGSVVISVRGDPFYIGYCPLSINDWYLATVYSGEISSGNAHISKLLLFGSLSLIALMIIIVAITLILQVKNQKILLSLAYDDPVTGGGNEVWFSDRFKEQIHRSQEGSYALLTINIDRFKVFNDEFGHDEGDRLLKAVYTELSSMLLKDEYASRTIFDLFCVLIRYTSEKDLENRLIDFVYRINSLDEMTERKYFLSFRIGGYHIYDNTTAYHVALDRALLASNKGHMFCNGLLKLGFFSDASRRILLEEKNLENCMEQALKDGEFEVYYQPKYSLSDDTVAGAEALIRWNSSVYGFLPPDRFIPLFERNGFIRRIDIFVFEQVCRQFRKWQDEGRSPIPISINLSRTYIDDVSFFDIYSDLVMKYDVDPSFIELELTETVAFDNMDKLTSLIEDIHRIGFSISLDDFGSGYSSLNTLKNLKVDTVKLDKAFFDINGNDTLDSKIKADRIVSSVLDLASDLAIKTVAEGVEHKKQLEFLKGTSCDMVQGYIYSKPLKLAEFDALLKVQAAKKE